MNVLIAIFGEGRNLDTIQMVSRAVVAFIGMLVLIRISPRSGTRVNALYGASGDGDAPYCESRNGIRVAIASSSVRESSIIKMRRHGQDNHRTSLKNRRGGRAR
jgi:hypothetical protein